MGAGLRLKEILRQRKMTIKELSRITGVSLNTLYSITKRDSATIDPAILSRIVAALNISEAEFYETTSTDSRNKTNVRIIDLFAGSGGFYHPAPLDDVDIAFYGSYKELSEDDKETIRRMVEVMRERRKKPPQD